MPEGDVSQKARELLERSERVRREWELFDQHGAEQERQSAFSEAQATQEDRAQTNGHGGL